MPCGQGEWRRRGLGGRAILEIRFGKPWSFLHVYTLQRRANVARRTSLVRSANVCVQRGVRDPRCAITGRRETRTDLKYNLLVINKICIYKGEKVSRHATRDDGTPFVTLISSP